jgi:hypothetical protein
MSSYIPDQVLQRVIDDAVDLRHLTPPVSLNALARSIGVGGIVNGGPIEGCVDLEVDRPIIRLSRELTKNRRRFTLAHELSHVLIYRAQRSGSLRPSDQLERMCDRIAAKVLLPDGWIEPLASRQWTLDDLESYASQAEVSVAALVNRISDLGGPTTWLQAQAVIGTNGTRSRWVVIQRAGAKGPFARQLVFDIDTSHALSDMRDGLHRRRVGFHVDGRRRSFDATVRKRGLAAWFALVR